MMPKSGPLLSFHLPRFLTDDCQNYRPRECEDDKVVTSPPQLAGPQVVIIAEKLARPNTTKNKIRFPSKSGMRKAGASKFKIIPAPFHCIQM